MKLSDRLAQVASFVTEGNRLADIGTDHAYIPIYLVKNGIIPSATAMDVSCGSLMKAERNIALFGLSDKIEVRISDGLENLSEGEADAILISGMGGKLICNILERGAKTAYSAKELILSPHSDTCLVREYLSRSRYSIIREAMVRDRGKYYTVIKAVKCVKCEMNDEGISEEAGEYIYGKYLNAHSDEVFAGYLNDEYEKLKAVLSELNGHKKKNNARIAEIENKIYANRRRYYG